MDIQNSELWIHKMNYGYPKMNYGYQKINYGYQKMNYGYQLFSISKNELWISNTYI